MTLGPIRFHHLKAVGRSPLHCLTALTIESEQTAAMERGSAVHAIMFGTKQVVFYPGKVRHGKQWEAFESEHANDMIVTRKDYDSAHRTVEAIHRHEIAVNLLRGEHEKTLLFKDTGVECRATPDVRGDGFITELKTGATTDPFRFGGLAIRMGYHAQLAWYMNAVKKTKTGNPTKAFIVACEQTAPHAVTVMKLTDRALEKGHALCRMWLERIKVSMDSNSWPAYSDAVVDLDVPDDEFQLKFADDEPAQELPF